MEETLGKRISANRKGLGLTQDALAEQLGVTAQAVSKWENDQSCPDITMLPKLAQIFRITTDELLGLERGSALTGEIVTEEKENQDSPSGSGGEWALRWDSGQKSTLGLALWVFLAGFMLLLTASELFPSWLSIGLWDILWTTGLLVYGLVGLYPNFSVFRLGCALCGG